MIDSVTLNENDCVLFGSAGNRTLVCPHDDDTYVTVDCNKGAKGGLGGSVDIEPLDLTLAELQATVDMGGSCEFDFHDNSVGFF